MNSERKIWVLALSMAVALSVFFVLCSPGVDRDAIARYAVMAEEFARGNWQEAFHPKYCVLLQTLAGILVWMLGVSGLAACQIVATFGWCIAAIPLWHLTRRCFNERAAWLAAGVLLVIPEYFLYGAGGMRDAFRILPYALMALGAVSRPLWLGLGLFFSATLRVDGILVGGAVLLAYVLLKAFERDFRAVILPVALFVLALAADSTGTLAATGHFIPTTYGKVLVAAPTPAETVSVAAETASYAPQTQDAELLRQLGNHEKLEPMAVHFIVLLAVSFVVFIRRVILRRETREEIVAIVIVALADVCILGVQLVVSMKHGGGIITFWRYHYPAYALLLVAVSGLVAGWLAHLRYGRWLAALAILVLFGNNVRSMLCHYCRPDRSVQASQVVADRWAAELIRKDWKGPARTAPASDGDNYACSRLPVVYCLLSPRSGYWCGGRAFEPWKARAGTEVLPDYWLCSAVDERFLPCFYNNPPRERIGEFRTRRMQYVLYRTAVQNVHADGKDGGSAK